VRVVADLEPAAVLVLIEQLGPDELRLTVAIPANLEVLLQ
jgi:hypothetical protein